MVKLLNFSSMKRRCDLNGRVVSDGLHLNRQKRRMTLQGGGTSFILDTGGKVIRCRIRISIADLTEVSEVTDFRSSPCGLCISSFSHNMFDGRNLCALSNTKRFRERSFSVIYLWPKFPGHFIYPDVVSVALKLLDERSNSVYGSCWSRMQPGRQVIFQ